ncbi:MAG: motility associated factor glycosyltransferase family protein [Treponema sp.]|nr:motility associated factor glycosyltransferase family protein [Treponema sp.]
MSSIWNKNVAAFCRRFPALAQQCRITAHTKEPENSPFEILTAKNGSTIAKASGKFLHSQYNPEREAEQAINAAKKDDCTICTFLSCGLGYAPNLYAKKFPKDTVIVVEPDITYFLAALQYTDWTDFFSAEHCIVILDSEPQTVITLIQNAGGFSRCAFIANNNQMEHAADYFSRLSTAIDHAKQQTQINENTAKKFQTLWLRNTCINLTQLAKCDGISRYKDVCPQELPAVILAAGPTLDEILPHLQEIKQRALLICVDTALRACLRSGVEPDFIVLTDPQYYAARHIAGLAAPHAILITETAVCPSVFRFPCKEIILCSSFFPLSRQAERFTGEKGSLSSGGSVSTTAWEFARYSGAKTIYFAGLDLGYPALQTHIRGSTFEEKIHTISSRNHPAETAGTAALFGANMLTASDYAGNPILTDNRMRMFGSWFENKLKEYPHVQTFSFSEKSLAIAGVTVTALDTFLRKDENSNARNAFFAAGEKRRFTPNEGTAEKIFKFFSEASKVYFSGTDNKYVRRIMAQCETTSRRTDLLQCAQLCNNRFSMN